MVYLGAESTATDMETRDFILKGFRRRARPPWRKTSWMLGDFADLWAILPIFRERGLRPFWSSDTGLTRVFTAYGDFIAI